MRKLKFPIIYVEYLDHSWLDGKTAKDIKKSKAPIIKEVGFLLGEDKTGIKFCKTIMKLREPQDKSISFEDATLILKSNIIKIIKFKEI
ncbi:MAG: hypothetical protein QW076_02455 [Candidatus Anstonellales archaeon]